MTQPTNTDEKPQVVTMKLDATDYENIYLRVRERLSIFLISVFGAIAAAIGVAGIFTFYHGVNSATEKAVNEFVKTNTFKQSVVDTTSAKTIELQKQADLIAVSLEKSEKRVATLAKLPITVDGNGVAMIGTSGEKFFIETGTAHDGETVKFHNPYKNPPTVIMNVTGDNFGPYRDRFPNERRMNGGYAPNVSAGGFSLAASVNQRTYSWVAIGQ